MRTFLQSGGAFLLVALLCLAAGLVADNGAFLFAAGGFWLVAAVIVRAKSAKKPESTKKD